MQSGAVVRPAGGSEEGGQSPAEGGAGLGLWPGRRTGDGSVAVAGDGSVAVAREGTVSPVTGG